MRLEFMRKFTIFACAMLCIAGPLRADQLLRLERSRGDVRVESLTSLPDQRPLLEAVGSSQEHLRIVRAGEPDVELAVEFQRSYPENGMEHASVRVPNLANGDRIEVQNAGGMVTRTLQLDLKTVLAADTQLELLQKALHAPKSAAPVDLREFAVVQALQSRNELRELQAVQKIAGFDPMQSQKRLQDWELKNYGIGGQCGYMTTGKNNPVPKDLRLPIVAKTAVSVSGRFVAPNGQPQPNIGAYVYLIGASSSSNLAQISANSSGQFTVQANVGDNLQFLPIGVTAPLVEYADIRATVNSSASVGDLVIPNGATLTVRTLQPNGQVLLTTSDVIFRDISLQRSIVTRTFGGLRRLGVPTSPPHVWELQANAIAPFVGLRMRAGVIGSDQTVNITLPTGALIPGQVSASNGAALPENSVSIECRSAFASGQQSIARATSAANGSLALYVLPQVSYDCSFKAIPEGYFVPKLAPRRFVLGDRLDLTLERASVVEVRVNDSSGTSLGILGVTTVDGTSQNNCFLSPCLVVANSTQASYLAVDILDNLWLPPSMIGPRVFNNETVVLTANRKHFYRGTVSPSDVNDPGKLRIYSSSGEFLTSTTVYGGAFQIPLKNGSYRAEFDFNEQDSFPEPIPNIYRQPITTNLLIDNADVVQNIQLPEENPWSLRIAGPCIRPNYFPPVSFSLRQNDILIATTKWVRVRQILADPAPGQCRYEWQMKMPFGNYNISMRVPGWSVPAQNFSFGTPGQTLDVTALPGASIWYGRLEAADGQAVGGARLKILDEVQRYVTERVTALDGSFSVPIAEGMLVEFVAPNGGRSMRKRIVMGPDFVPPKVVRLDNIVFQSGSLGSLERLYGDGDLQRKFNIVFVAESYTTINESYTDSNGNGAWDGVVWHDLNNNGSYDYSDLASAHGNAAEPSVGSNPTLQNEPFVDLNGDGFRNRNEQALFRLNAEAFMRSWLGSDVWERHRDKFNAYLLFLPSEQAGYDVINAAGQTLVSRNSRFNASLDLTRNILSLDSGSVLGIAESALPEVNLAVALINQPIAAGRATGGNPMVFYGGWKKLSPNSDVEAHEMGHAIGRLADEYEEFNAVLTEWPASGSVNSARTTRLALLPWRDDLPIGATFPTRLPAANGVFEGSSYHAGGAYRPSHTSIMRGIQPLFNAVSARAIDARMRAYGDAAQTTIFASGFEN
jgi:hypothetical protein